MGYRIDNIPLILRPVYWLVTTLLGTFFVFTYWLVRRTCRIEYLNRDRAEALPNAIYILWHENWIPYFICFPRHENHVWMSHAAWYMKQVFVVLWWLRVREVIPGSTGDGGREAANRLVVELKRGKSTVVAPDGPHGPRRVLKKGALHMSHQSGVPIVPLRFELSAPWIIPGTWDGKRYPRPFSRVRIFFGEPVQVSAETFERSAASCQRQLAV